MSASEDVDHDSWTKQLRKNLETCLQDIKDTGPFAYFEVQGSGVPLPDIYIDGYGSISLPLSDQDAQAIFTQSFQVPFGKRTPDIDGTDARRRLELSLGEFSLENSNQWEEWISSMVAKVDEQLGFDEGNIRAELQKLLLDEQGASFPRQESEKCPGMFGPLVIGLPSQHQGGDVHVTYAGRTYPNEPWEFSQSDFSVLAWYSDVSHKVSPLKSGCRLVFTYKLVQTVTVAPTMLAIKLFEGICKFKNFLCEWQSVLSKKEENMGPITLACVFEHKYTDASMCFDALKGHDRKVASVLKDVCRDEGFGFYLANCGRRIVGRCEQNYNDGHYHPITEETERSTELKHVVRLDGTKISEPLKLDENWIIQADLFKINESDKQNCVTESEGSLVTHIYTRTVGIIVVLPSSQLPPLTAFPQIEGDSNCVPKINEFLESLLNEMSMDSGSNNSLLIRDKTSIICRVLIEDISSKKPSTPCPEHIQCRESYPALILERVLVAAVELGDCPLFKDTLAVFKLCIGHLPFSLYIQVGKMMKNHYNSELHQLAVSELQSVDGFAHCKALLNFSNGVLDTSQGNSVSSRSSAEADVASTGDGVALCHTRTVLKDLIKDFLKNFKMDTMTLFDSTAASSKSQDQESSEMVKARKNGEDIVGLLVYCLELGLHTEVDQFLCEVGIQAESVHLGAFHDLLLPLLKQLVKTFKDEDLVSFHTLFQTILSKYIVRYVEVKPLPNWGRVKEKKCFKDCSDCKDLQKFMNDPSKREARFHMLYPQGGHIICQAGNGYASEINRSGHMHTLVLTKKMSQVDSIAKEAWEERVAIARKQIRDIGSENSMRTLLGNVFQPIWLAGAEESSADGLGPGTPTTMESNISPSNSPPAL